MVVGSGRLGQTACFGSRFAGWLVPGEKKGKEEEEGLGRAFIEESGHVGFGVWYSHGWRA